MKEKSSKLTFSLKKGNVEKKQRKPKKERPRLKKFMRVAIVVCSIILICATVACAYIYNFAVDYINGDKKVDLDVYKANQAQTSIIYAYDSNKELVELLRLHGAENRLWIEYDDIPQDCLDDFFNEAEEHAKFLLDCVKVK